MLKKVVGHESASLKLDRASKTIKAIDGEVSRYLSGNPYEVVSQADGTSDVKVLCQPNVSLGVLVGEVIYHLRSALDHLTFEVIQKYPRVPECPKDWQEKCGFPMRFNLRDGEIAPLSKRSFHSWFAGIPDELFTFIESLQPYNRGYYPSLVKSIGNFSNIDKHRHLNVSVGIISASEYVYAPVGDSPQVFIPVQVTHGTDFKLDRPGHVSTYNVDVQRDFSPSVIVFDKSRDSGYFPLPSGLVECLRLVGGVILPEFRKFV